MVWDFIKVRKISRYKQNAVEIKTNFDYFTTICNYFTFCFCSFCIAFDFF